MSISQIQTERKAAEKWYGPWDEMREAILAAKGARECADVENEQSDE